MVWSSEYSFFIPELDLRLQHGIKTMNGFHAAMLMGKGKDNLQKMLHGNVQRFSYELTAGEEQLMAAVDYPNLRQHHEEHEAIRRKARELIQRLQGGENTITIEQSLFLAKFVENHIKSSDRRLAEYLRRNGGASALRALFAKRRQGNLPVWQPAR